MLFDTFHTTGTCKGHNQVLQPKNNGEKVKNLLASLYEPRPVRNEPAIRVFSKVDNFANVARIVLVEYTIGSVVELNFC